MRTWLIPLSLFLVTTALFGQDAPPRLHPHVVPFGPLIRIPVAQEASSARHLVAKPTFAPVYSPQVLQYATSSDIPNYNAGFDGNGVALTNGIFPRNKYAVGIQTDGMNAGGCVPLDPMHPYSGCVMLPNASGTLVQALIAREVWTFRISYLDPTNPSATEVNIGFANGFGGGSGDWNVEWVARTAGGHSCFTFYPCDYYGLDLDYLTGTAAISQPSCTMKLGPCYHAYIYYQASPYDAGAVPAGAQEWYPATTAATATRLAQPGGIIWQNDYALGRADNALQIGGPGIVHPAIAATGYTGIHDPLNLGIGSIPPGSGTVTITAYDCGVLPNVAFSISRAFIEGNSHAHAATMGQPPLDQVSSLDSYSGTTDSNGKWTTMLHAGSVGDTIQYTATTQNLLGAPFTAEPLLVTTGFASLVDPGVNSPNIRYTGNTSAIGLRHPSNHNGAQELHTFVRDLAAQYNARIGDPALQGSLGLNDMSLPVGGIFDLNGNWSSPHSQHSFGVACDIDHTVLRFSDGQGIPIDYQDTLMDVASDLGGYLLIESNNNDNLHVQIPEEQLSNVLLTEAR